MISHHHHPVNAQCIFVPHTHTVSVCVRSQNYKNNNSNKIAMYFLFGSHALPTVSCHTNIDFGFFFFGFGLSWF